MFQKWLSNIPKSLVQNGKDNVITEITNYFIAKIEQKLFHTDLHPFSLTNVSKHWLFGSYMRFLESLLMENLS